MKKTAIVVLAIITAVVFLFSACDSRANKDNETTTRLPDTSTTGTTETTERDTRDSMLNPDREDDSAGAPESTNQDSALGDAIEDAADGMADANERIADGVRDAQANNG